MLGFTGVAAIAINAYLEGGLELDFMLFSSTLGAFFFLYVAFFGALPWGMSGDRDSEKGKMSRTKWQVFGSAFVVFLLMATSFLSKKGVFEEANLVILGMVGILFALVGLALYFFVKDRPDDLR